MKIITDKLMVGSTNSRKIVSVSNVYQRDILPSEYFLCNGRTDPYFFLKCDTIVMGDPSIPSLIIGGIVSEKGFQEALNYMKRSRVRLEALLTRDIWVGREEVII